MCFRLVSIFFANLFLCYFCSVLLCCVCVFFPSSKCFRACWFLSTRCSFRVCKAIGRGRVLRPQSAVSEVLEGYQYICSVLISVKSFMAFVAQSSCELVFVSSDGLVSVVGRRPVIVSGLFYWIKTITCCRWYVHWAW